ncbi:decarboxylating 6-phosphogluconate dehydrogenase [Patescibacteria group bacterium]|nr:MAG: decarboxylating 6-phosphogluconate dehydrogenase [Patescibacteria group bacterium]
MRLGFVGLGKMGGNMVERMLERGHRPVIFARTKATVRRYVEKGAKGAGSLAEMMRSLGTGKRLVWIMVPHAAVDGVLDELIPLLKRGDTVVDGGNSPWTKSVERSARLKKRGIAFLDIGVSGGPAGARDGACLMIGGPAPTYRKLHRLFVDLSVKDGEAHLGPSGAGHFAKMVHNGIEYGMMQAFAEGFDVLRKKKAFRFDLRQVAGLYGHGSVVTSRLNGWLEDGFKTFGTTLKGVSGSAVGTGEGKWTVQTAKTLGVRTPVISASVAARVASMKKPSFQGQVVMVMRNRFGGHDPNPNPSTSLRIKKR